MVNPFDVSETADALGRALDMDEQERSKRCAALASAAAAMPPARWFDDQLDALEQTN
jgi:trehalose 6-phosphate synthase